MPPSVAVVIPALNESAAIADAIRSANGADEIVVADGGSTDSTVDTARAAGAFVVTSEPMRSRQMNAGAAATTSDALLFLHADTILPVGGIDLVRRAVERGAHFGGFRLSFAERVPRLRAIAFLANLRTALTRCPWGDQAQFVVRERFEALGGYREIPIMEDYDLACRIKRDRATVILDADVETSGRRFLQRGVIRTSLTNWRVVISWHLGADPERLAKIYRG